MWTHDVSHGDTKLSRGGFSKLSVSVYVLSRFLCWFSNTRGVILAIIYEQIGYVGEEEFRGLQCRVKINPLRMIYLAIFTSFVITWHIPHLNRVCERSTSVSSSRQTRYEFFNPSTVEIREIRLVIEG